MRVEDWFHEWLDEHMERHPRADWPKPADSPRFYDGWKRNFILRGIQDLDVAREASERLMADPPQFHGEHVKATIAAALAIYRERAEQGKGADPNSREAAELASRDCPDCGGQGLATRYRHRAAPGQAPSIVLYCTCRMGRWIERHHREKSPEVRHRIPDLAEHAWLRLGPVHWSAEPDNRFRYPPDAWDSYGDRPLAAESLRAIADSPAPPRPYAGLKPAMAGLPRPAGPTLGRPTPNVAVGPDGRFHEVPADGRPPWAKVPTGDAPAF